MATMTTPAPSTTLTNGGALLGTYKRAPMELVGGEGVMLFDAEGKSYLDFTSGIAVNALGYGDPGLRAALRQSPDVLFLGEIRDPETAITALHASETGHLVISTLHSSSVVETLDRFSHLLKSETSGALIAGVFFDEIGGWAAVGVAAGAGSLSWSWRRVLALQPAMLGVRGQVAAGVGSVLMAGVLVHIFTVVS